MPLPATSGQFRTRLEDMEIGDFIAYKAVGTSGVPCTISELGAPLATAQANEIPITGSASPNGYAYAIKNGKGMCISDRPIQHSISWDALNTAKLIQGKVMPVMDSITNQAQLIESSHYSNRDKAFDKMPGTYTSNGWQTPAQTGWVGQNFSLIGEKNIKYWGIIADAEYDLSNTMWGTFEGSNDSTLTTWDILDTMPSYTFKLGEQRIFAINNSKSYKYYRFNGSSTSGNPLLLAELGMWEDMPIKMLIRSLTGGNAYLGTDSKPTYPDQGLGAFPKNNEWDKYIVSSTLGGKIIAGDDNVWHWKDADTWVQDTTSSITASSSNRVVRGLTTKDRFDWCPSNGASRSFRPVFQFLEPNSKATNLFY